MYHTAIDLENLIDVISERKFTHEDAEQIVKTSLFLNAEMISNTNDEIGYCKNRVSIITHEEKEAHQALINYLVEKLNLKHIVDVDYFQQEINKINPYDLSKVVDSKLGVLSEDYLLHTETETEEGVKLLVFTSQEAKDKFVTFASHMAGLAVNNKKDVKYGVDVEYFQDKINDYDLNKILNSHLGFRSEDYSDHTQTKYGVKELFFTSQEARDKFVKFVSSMAGVPADNKEDEKADLKNKGKADGNSLIGHSIFRPARAMLNDIESVITKISRLRRA